MFRCDYHVHCEFSDDSREPMERQVKRGIELGLDEICFTDHVDYGIKTDWSDGNVRIRPGRTDTYLGNVDYPAYFSKLDRMREEYGDRIKVLNGLEFGIQTITVTDFEKLWERYGDILDFTLLSMHQVDNLEFWTQDYMKGKSQKEYNERYYREIYDVMNMFDHYCVLAHLDLLNRYDPLGIYPYEKVEHLIAEILKLAIKNGKGLEINTSSWHYGLDDTQPSRKILKLYKDLGGRIITIGSDAHSTAYLADHYEDALEILKDEIGFKEICSYKRMNPVFHRI